MHGSNVCGLTIPAESCDFAALNCSMFFFSFCLSLAVFPCRYNVNTEWAEWAFVPSNTSYIKYSGDVRGLKKASPPGNITILFHFRYFIYPGVNFYHAVTLIFHQSAQRATTPLPCQAGELDSKVKFSLCYLFWLKPSSWLPAMMFKQFLQLYNEAW